MMSLTAEEFSHVLALFKCKTKKLKSNEPTPSNGKPSQNQSVPVCSDQAGRLSDLSSSYTALTKSQDVEKRFLVNPVSCQFCSKQFQTRQMLRQHFLYRHASAGIKCPECFFIAKSQKDLEQHKCKVKQVLDCDKCDEKFRSKRDLMIHQKIHDVKYSCTHCEKSFSDMNRLKKHVKDCHVDGGFVCSTCSERFFCKESFSFHIKYAHLEDKPVKCSLCPKSFKNMKYLKVHANLMHKKKKTKVKNTADSRYQEQLIRARTILAKKIASNKLVSSEEQAPIKFKAKCPDCHKIVNSATTLYAHKVLHQNPKVCSKCKAEFAWTWHMKKHERICNGVPSTRMLNKKSKPYECFLCNRRFTNGSELTDHMRDHAKHDFGIGTTLQHDDQDGDEDVGDDLDDGDQGINHDDDDENEGDDLIPTSQSPSSQNLSEAANFTDQIDTLKSDERPESESTSVSSNGTEIPNGSSYVYSSQYSSEMSAVSHAPHWLDIRSRMETPIDFDERIPGYLTVPGSMRSLADSQLVRNQYQNYQAENSIPTSTGPAQTCNTSMGPEQPTNPAKYVLEKSCFPRYEYAQTSNKDTTNNRATSNTCSNIVTSEQPGPNIVTFSTLEDNLDSVQGILNEMFDTGGPISPISDSCLNTPYANSLLLLDDSFVVPHDML